MGLADAGDGEGWTIHWKEDGTSRIRDCILTFGISRTREAAIGKARRALQWGTARPLRTPEEFRRQFGGGVFYAVALHDGVPVARRGAA